jgi:hypothetical protein
VGHGGGLGWVMGAGGGLGWVMGAGGGLGWVMAPGCQGGLSTGLRQASTVRKRHPGLGGRQVWAAASWRQGAGCEHALSGCGLG